MDYSMFSVCFFILLLRTTHAGEPASTKASCNFSVDCKGIFGNMFHEHNSKYLCAEVGNGIEWLAIAEQTIIDADLNTVTIFLKGNQDFKVMNRLFSSPFCWASGEVDVHLMCSLRKFILCGSRNIDKFNDSESVTLHKIKNFPVINSDDSVHSIVSKIWPSFIVLAAEDVNTADKKFRSNHHTPQPNKRKPGTKSHHKQSETKTEQEEPQLSKVDKAICKYRKSCYDDTINGLESGKGMSYEPELIDSPEIDENLPSQEKSESYENESDEEISEDQQRLRCKYRTSCYEQRWPNLLSTKGVKHKGAASILTSKASSSVPPPSTFRKPTSVKEIAAETLKKLEERERHTNEKALPKFSPREKYLLDAKERLKQKNACKYRKSCYETGVLPSIEAGPLASLFTFQKNQTDSEKVERKASNHNPSPNFEEMSVSEQKQYCKYRKSCYESGMRPEIPDKGHIDEIIRSTAPREDQKLELRCKYRKSCYETGVLSPLNPPTPKQNEKTIGKAGNAPLPTTIGELKLMCKYRKSCYVTKAREAESQKSEEEKIAPALSQNASATEMGDLEEEPHHAATHNSDSTEVPQIPLPDQPVKSNKAHKTKKTPQVKTPRVPKPTKAPEMAPTPKPRAKKNEEYCGEEQEVAPPYKQEVPVPLYSNIKIVKEPAEEISAPLAGEEKNEDDSFKSRENEETNGEIRIDREQKLQCKYRKSCYISEGLISEDIMDNLTPQMKSKCKYRHSCYADILDVVPHRNWSAERVIEQTRMDKVSNRDLPCNKYYLSCREKLGLPPKEAKPPRAANGKKLCRKKTD
ncbi:hypothetical protein DdX_02010 [Ditylenchus destructor]|uniref:Uncharacterized protein n=1 Tax=Ditylenchus destructor TaxID=166010 RepID=A0AAD4NDC6_9BILA|nr:hypothetical protein DdX_02010 [Ditylenchus destructor]